MRIAYVITRGDSIGGAQIHVRDMATYASSQGHEVRVFAGTNGHLSTQLAERGISFEVVPSLVQPLSPLKDFKAVSELKVAFKTYKPDVVSSHSSKAGVVARIAGACAGVPVVFTAHGWSFTTGVPPLKRFVYQAIERAVAPLAAHIICVSEYDRELALNARIGSPESLVTIHNGMPDVEEAYRADPTREPPKIVMVARLDTQKDHRTILEALTQVPGVTLDLVGDGPKTDETKGMVERLGLGTRVNFLGHRSDIKEILATAQMFALTTNYEGFPRSILEAMRAGLPVIASNVGGVSEAVLDGETGYAVPRGSVLEVQRRIAELVAAPALRQRLGRNGRLRYEENFRASVMFDRTLSILARAAERG